MPAPLDRQETIRRLVSLHTQLKTAKLQQATTWEDVLRYTMAHKAAVLNPPQATFAPFDEIFDASGMLAASEFAANLYAYASPPSESWFWLAAPPGSQASRDRTYMESLAQRTEALHNAFRQSNFETEVHSCYQDLALGTCCLATVRDETEVTPFELSARPISEYCFLENQKGQPETVFVERRYTAVEAADKFGKAKLSPELQEQIQNLDAAAYSTPHSYLNVIRPNRQWDPTRLGPAGYPYESLWISLEKEPQLLNSTGRRRQAYTIARFWGAAGLTWGYGPSQMAYGPIRCLDKALEIILKYAAKTMDPPSIWPHEGAYWPMEVGPGQRIIGQRTALEHGQPKFLELQGDHHVTQFIFEYIQAQIARAYLVHVFQVLSDQKQRTAREVAAILQKDYTLAVPIFARLRGELFAPFIRNALELLTEYELGIHGWRYGGQALPDYEYNLELISPLGLAVKLAQLQKLSDLIALNSPLAEVRSDVWDNYTLDDMSRAIGENMAVPQAWLRPIAERDLIRQRRAELLAQREMVQQTQLAAKAAKDLGKGAEPTSPMAALMGAA